MLLSAPTLAAAMVGSPAFAQSVLSAAFTPVPIHVDGIAEPAWSNAPAQNIAICMNPALTQQLADCRVSGTVQALWNGPILYLLFAVTDPDITTVSGTDTNRSSVQVYVDQYNDKFPKFEEDDSDIIISAAGQQTGNLTNAGLKYYPTSWSYHLQSYAAAPRYDTKGNQSGYTVEVGWYIGDRPLRNGTKLGMEFVINAASSATNTLHYQLYWSSGNNKGLNDNRMWGDVLLTGYHGGPMQLNTFMLGINIAKATAAADSTGGLVRGIWTDETQLDRALRGARIAMATATAQQEIDFWDRALDRALRGLRRKGKHPDPYDLPTVNNLPDPFTFLSGRKVRFPEDWHARRAEIEDLAQYYEFGSMPAPPQSLTAVSTNQTAGSLSYKSIAIAVQDKGSAAAFTPILYLPTTGSPPYPVIVEADIFANPTSVAPNPAFLKGGYAVLSIPTWDLPAFGFHGIASDDGKHTGAFFDLYPYKLDSAGDDHGVLLAWAWGASRGVDALCYLSAHDPAYANLLDLKKLVVTGYSRWGKTALLAGMLDERFQLTAPGGSGSGGATPYRYDSFGNLPFRHAPFGNLYPWGRSPGAETLGDHIRHQTHNSNEMMRRFLNDSIPAAVEPRMYQTDTWGYGERLPYDHHEEIAAIAPRAVLIDATNNDYADNAEGDAIGFEGAQPIYACLGVPQNLALDLDMGNTGHALTPAQAQHIVDFANFVLYGIPLAADVKAQLTTDPYLEAGTYDTYYGGLETMMPWARHPPCDARQHFDR
jgi:endo-1,4-beta-xylanase